MLFTNSAMAVAGYGLSRVAGPSLSFGSMFWTSWDLSRSDIFPKRRRFRMQSEYKIWRRQMTRIYLAARYSRRDEL